MGFAPGSGVLYSPVLAGHAQAMDATRSTRLVDSGWRGQALHLRLGAGSVLRSGGESMLSDVKRFIYYGGLVLASMLMDHHVAVAIPDLVIRGSIAVARQPVVHPSLACSSPSPESQMT